MTDAAPSDDGRFHDIAHAVLQAYTPEGQANWWRAWATHPDARARMEAGMLAAWSGEPTDGIVASDDEREALTLVIREAGENASRAIESVSGDTEVPDPDEMIADAILAAGFHQGPVSVSREQVEKAVHAGRVWDVSRSSTRDTVDAVLAALGITVAD